MPGTSKPAALFSRKRAKPPTPPGYLTRRQAAERIERSKFTLDKYAKTKRHIDFKKIGKKTYYLEKDVDAYKALRDREKQSF